MEWPAYRESKGSIGPVLLHNETNFIYIEWLYHF